MARCELCHRTRRLHEQTHARPAAPRSGGATRTSCWPSRSASSSSSARLSTPPSCCLHGRCGWDGLAVSSVGGLCWALLPPLHLHMSMYGCAMRCVLHSGRVWPRPHCLQFGSNSCFFSTHGDIWGLG